MQPSDLSRVIVTGGAGFIGSQLVRALEARGAEVFVVDKLTYAGRRDNLNGTKAKLYTVDVCDAHLLVGLFEQLRPTAIAHLAAESHVDASFDGLVDFMRANAIGTERLLGAAWKAKVSRVLHVSTDEVFGSVPNGYLRTENNRLAPRNPYSASKAAAEMVVESYRESFGLPVVMVRLSNCYGPRQHVEKLIPRTVARIVAGEPATLHSDGLQTREWLHVGDAARGIVAALELGRPGGTYNLPGSVERSVRTVVSMIAEELREYRPRIVQEGDRVGGTDRRYGMAGDLAHAELSWRQSIDFRVGLRDTVRWYLANPTWLGDAPVDLINRMRREARKASA